MTRSVTAIYLFYKTLPQQSVFGFGSGGLNLNYMRFKIIFSEINGSFLPVNHNSYISSWIYKRIAEADAAFAEFLHSQGYGEGNKHFKFFNFAPLDFKPYKPHWDRGVFELMGNEMSLEVSFYLPEIAEPFIKGLFKNNEVFIGDRINGVHANVREVQVLPYPEFKEKMRYHIVSPCCIRRPANESEKYSQYLHPQDQEFIPRLVQNLKNKYHAVPNIPAVAGTDDELSIRVKIPDQKLRSKLLTVKAMTEAENKIRGWLFHCEVTAPVEVQEFIWNVGLGEKGSLGFGMVGIR